MRNTPHVIPRCSLRVCDALPAVKGRTAPVTCSTCTSTVVPQTIFMSTSAAPHIASIRLLGHYCKLKPYATETSNETFLSQKHSVLLLELQLSLSWLRFVGTISPELNLPAVNGNFPQTTRASCFLQWLPLRLIPSNQRQMLHDCKK